MHTLCSWCNEVIDDDDDKVTLPLYGVPGKSQIFRHQACNIRACVGGINHQLGKCICCGGTEPPDPEDMTRREAAKAAAKMFMEKL